MNRKFSLDKMFFLFGSSLAGLSVGMGAFGAHGLKHLVAADLLVNWETAARYQMYHALALLAVVWAISHWPQRAKLLTVGGWLFVAGVALFSGSLYLLTLTGVRWLGAITPLGGVAFVAGWACLTVAAWKSSWG